MSTILYREGDTVVAPATAPGVGALAVVRISGPDAISIADRIFSGATPSRAPLRTMHHGTILSVDGEPIDEVLLTVFRTPHSYTGEDSVEISCHGAPYLVRRIVDRVVAEGARLAGPGEFTRRAFRNGRIDLAQAEAVADVIQARSAGAARSALRQLHGGLSKRLQSMRHQLIDVLADVEADLDFAAEEEVPSYDREAVKATLGEVLTIIRDLIEKGERGRIVRDGVRVVIAGRPNAGKSTLFNALLEEDRAIVSEEPGTTRDVLEGEIELGGILFTLHDTAGEREEATGAIETEGIQRAKAKQKEADIVLRVADRSVALTGDEKRLARGEHDLPRHLLVFTKGDLPAGPDAAAFDDAPRASRPLTVCVPSGEGLDELRADLLRLAVGEKEAGAGKQGVAGDADVTSRRHLQALRTVERAVVSGAATVREGELLAEDLRAALNGLDEITGEGAREELLDEIFSRFCIGK